MDLERATSLYQLFADNAERAPSAIAVTDGARQITYRELRAAAEGFRAGLAAHGVPAGERVGIALPRGWEVVAAILAVLAHGCAYVPLDLDYPPKRLTFMAEDSGIRVAIMDAGRAALPSHIVAVSAQSTPPSPPPVHTAPPGTPAYVMYTSGSTGRPKGVMVPERAVLALFRSALDVYSFGPHDVWTWFHSYSFDFSVWEIWGALIFGGRLVNVGGETARRAPAFLDLLAAERVTVLNQVPSFFKYVVKAYERAPAPLALRYVIFGGEALDRPSVRRWLEQRPRAETLVNMYGITETTVHVTHRRIEPADVAGDAGGTRIGLPLRHLSIALLDGEGRPVPPGAVGEIHVSGSSLADGYLGQPELTGQRFRWLAVDGVVKRWYRSGDEARQAADGSFEYLGRNDRQVNLRGFRIELGEIEAVLRRPAAVLDAVVEVETVGGDERILVAYVVAAGAPDGPPLVEAALRQACEAELPAYMVPNRIVVVPAVPLTPSGKLDRVRLRAEAR